MKASIISLLITLILLSVSSSSNAHQVQYSFPSSLVIFEGSERLSSDLNLDDNENPILFAHSKTVRPYLYFQSFPLTQPHVTAKPSAQRPIRAPPSFIDS